MVLSVLMHGSWSCDDLQPYPPNPHAPERGKQLEAMFINHACVTKPLPKA